MLETIKSPLLLQETRIHHAFFTRKGGVSKGIYQGLNCGTASKDDPYHIAMNQQLALAHIGAANRSLASYHALHGDRAVIVEHPNSPCEEADAVVTSNPAIVLGADSADCPTVLLADTEARVIGLAHAGWRSALGGILEATVGKMQSLGAMPSQIVAAIGPGIQQASYEISQSFYLQFCKDDSSNTAFFRPASRAGHWMFDLPGYIHQRLIGLGLKEIDDLGLDTYVRNDFYSCRRSFHEGLDDFGGHFACLYLTEG
jgi:YfiH family protein